MRRLDPRLLETLTPFWLRSTEQEMHDEQQTTNIAFPLSPRPTRLERWFGQL
jgi:hypothetical protein